jgi:hypothetical protein
MKILNYRSFQNKDSEINKKYHKQKAQATELASGKISKVPIVSADKEYVVP